MGTHMPYRITQCYLPPDRGDIPAFIPAEAGIRLRPRRDARLSWPSWLVTYRDGMYEPTQRRSPIQVLTGPDVLVVPNIISNMVNADCVHVK